MSTVGTKNYNGQDWFWPHDYRHYLRDANARQRKLIHNGWLKIGVPVKKTGQKISDLYLEPKKNQIKKAWMIVRKVVAPKELGQPIPESTNEGFAVNEKMGPEQFHRYMQYVFDTQYKSPEDKAAKKRIIKKLNVVQKKKGLPLYTEAKVKLKGKWKHNQLPWMQGPGKNITTKKGKTVKAVHTKSGKEIVVVDTPASRKKLKRMGFKVESINEAISWGQLKTFLISVSRSGAKNMDGVKINPQTAKAILDYGNSSVSNRKKLEKLPIKKMISLDKVESVSEGIFSSWMVDKAIKIANKMGGDMTGAVKTIEKFKRGLSKDKKVQDALQKANEGSCGYGIDGKVGSQPAGPHLLKKKKKKVDEFMNKQMAGETLKQLGGRRFIAMTGAKNMAVGTDGMVMKIGRNSKGVNYVRIDLKGDLYTMEFIRMRSGKETVLKKVKGVYNDQLQKMFTKHTGMYTSL